MAKRAIARGWIALLLVFSGIAIWSPAGLASADNEPSVVATIPVAGPVAGVAVNPSANRVYVISGPTNVTVLDGQSNAILTTFSVAADPSAHLRSIAVNAKTGRVYLGDDTDVFVVDGTTYQTVTRVTLPNNRILLAGPVWQIEADPVANVVYLAASGGVEALDGVSSFVLVGFPVGGAAPSPSAPTWLAVDSTSRRVFATGGGSGTLTVLDGQTNAMSGSVAVPAVGYLAANPNTSRLYDAQADTLLVIDSAANVVSGEIGLPTTFAPVGSAVNATLNHIYVAEQPTAAAPSPSGVLSVIDGAAGAVLAEVPVDGGVSGVAVNPATNRAYVFSRQSNQVQVVQDAPGSANQTAVHDGRYFGQTGYRVDDDVIWDYFNRRGGVSTFGYPISRTFRFQSSLIQMFQRRIVQLDPNNRPRLLNLLDNGLLPYTSFNGATFPAIDPQVENAAPPSTDVLATLAFVQAHAPDRFDAGLPVNFTQTFTNTVPLFVAFPSGSGNADLLPGFDLEMWGVPTSGPAYDPRNHNVVYLRFQRGIMMYDAGCQCTQGILLADYLKSILTGQNLPPDLADEASASPLLRQYDPTQPRWIHQPPGLPGSDLTNAFAPE
jgi:hypothetical protein